ncbi:MAG: TraX family protein [Clostridia bacterium]
MNNLTSNTLKIIAICTMILDHIALYFHFLMPANIYLICRAIGRISMPIFVFLLIEGFFHTKDIKKYIIRLISIAIITQIAISIISYVNIIYVPNYIINVYKELNIVFSLSLTMALICLIDKKDILPVNIITKILRISLIFIILVLFIVLPIDYQLNVPLMAIGLYIAYKIKDSKKLNNINIVNKLLVSTSIILPSILQGFWVIFTPLALPFIFVYNNKLGYKSTLIKKMFYLSFFMQHILLYILSLLIFSFKIV